MNSAKTKARPKRKQRQNTTPAITLEDVNRLEVASEWVAPSALVSYAKQLSAHAGIECSELRDSTAAGEAITGDLTWDLNGTIVGIWRLLGMVEQSLIDETNGLWDLPPIWLIDQRLHDKRESLLRFWFPKGGFVKGGDFINFGGISSVDVVPTVGKHTEPNITLPKAAPSTSAHSAKVVPRVSMTLTGPVVRVSSTDCWHFDEDNRNDMGSGLVSLAARLQDKPVHFVAAQLASLVGLARDRS